MSSRSRAPDAVEETLDRIEDLLRELSPRVLGAVVRRYGHFDLSEDAVQRRCLLRFGSCPWREFPRTPCAWLITVAARRLADLFRSDQARRRREMEVTLREERLAPTADSRYPATTVSCCCSCAATLCCPWPPRLR
jgi:predicted RNA polymerase sigma factor